MKITNEQFPQDCSGLRADAYPSSGRQRGAFAKMLKALVALLTDEQRAAFVAMVDADDLAVLDEIDAVKRRLPKGKPKT